MRIEYFDGIPIVIHNVVTPGTDHYVSYHPYSEDYGSSTTAFVTQTRRDRVNPITNMKIAPNSHFYILNGDHQKALAQCPDTPAKVKYLIDNKDLKNTHSESFDYLYDFLVTEGYTEQDPNRPTISERHFRDDPLHLHSFYDHYLSYVEAKQPFYHPAIALVIPEGEAKGFYSIGSFHPETVLRQLTARSLLKDKIELMLKWESEQYLPSAQVFVCEYSDDFSKLKSLL